MYTFKTLSTFPYVSIEILKETMISLELPKSHSLAISSQKRTFSASGLSLCGLYAHIIRITSLPNVSTIAIILTLFLLTSTTFLDIFSFSKIPIPRDLASFPDHHSLYLHPQVSTKRAPWPFHLTSCMQHTSTLLFLSSSHTSVFFPQKLPTFEVPSLISWHSGLNQEILRTPAHLRAARDWGQFYFFFLSWEFVGAKFF